MVVPVVRLPLVEVLDEFEGEDVVLVEYTEVDEDVVLVEYDEVEDEVE